MTVVRLLNGDLFLHSPIKFDERLAKELHRLGRVDVDIDFTRDLEVNAPEEWRREIDQLLFPAAISRSSFSSTRLQRR